MVLVEVCVDSVEGARVAVEQGVARVELCAALPLGGLTPSMGLVRVVRDATAAGTQLMVLIRPRGGDFVYSGDELAIMAVDIDAVAEVGADGVVLGCLQADGSVNEAATRALANVARAHGLTVTFHRAFDVSRDLSEALEAVIRVGAQRVLTSGGRATAEQGQQAIRQLVQQAAGRITILAGGGVRASNAAALVAATGVTELHSAASRTHDSVVTFRRPYVPLSTPADVQDHAWRVTCSEQVRELMAAVAGGPQSSGATPVASTASDARHGG